MDAEAQELIINESALKHGVSEDDIRTALGSYLLDVAIEDYDERNKYLLVGFDRKGNMVELMYNIIDTYKVNVFHAMKCRKKYLQLIGR